ncbi:MAG TPA: acyltransferase [Planctomycetia bacterium]|nr:acyltransferase [Planctomycetia bacterium]
MIERRDATAGYSLRARLRAGEGPFWGGLKRAAKATLTFHVPVVGPLRAFFKVLYSLHVALREGLAWALRFFWYEPLFRSQCESVGANLWMERLPYLEGVGRIVVGDGVRLSGKQTIGFAGSTSAMPELVIGDGTFIGHGCAFYVGKSFRIGRNCLIAGDVTVYDLDGHPLDAAERRGGKPTPASGIKPVVLGDDVWIGRGAMILKGVSIGDRSIVGARSLVTRHVPPDSIVAGNPARIVRKLV